MLSAHKFLSFGKMVQSNSSDGPITYSRSVFSYPIKLILLAYHFSRSLIGSRLCKVEYYTYTYTEETASFHATEKRMQRAKCKRAGS